jgi:hypothetical protein
MICASANYPTSTYSVSSAVPSIATKGDGRANPALCALCELCARLFIHSNPCTLNLELGTFPHVLSTP